MKTDQDVSISKTEIDVLTAAFFRAVSFLEGAKPTYKDLYLIFIENGQLIKNSGTAPEIASVTQFIEPRQLMVDSGALTSFREQEIAEITDIFGNIAHRFSTYEKHGISKGTSSEGRGIISIQYVMTDAGWKISSMVWDDERPGLTIPDKYQ